RSFPRSASWVRCRVPSSSDTCATPRVDSTPASGTRASFCSWQQQCFLHSREKLLERLPAIRQEPRVSRAPRRPKKRIVSVGSMLPSVSQVANAVDTGEMTGGDALVGQLLREGTATLFAVPGVQLDWATDALRRAQPSISVY